MSSYRHSISIRHAKLPTTTNASGIAVLSGVARPADGGPAVLLDIHSDKTLTVVPARPQDAHSASEAAPATRKLSICVLPFANMSDDPQQKFFADGVVRTSLYNAFGEPPTTLPVSTISSSLPKAFGGLQTAAP